MLCEGCGLHQATYHYTSIVNGQKVERHLCEECAAKLGAGSEWALGNILAGLLGYLPKEQEPSQQEQTIKRCPGCGWTLEQIQNTGLVGCAQCYDTFENELGQVIKHVQGKDRHVGASPAGTPETQGQGADQLEALRVQMAQAVEKEDFEQAAVLRDKIKALEGEGAVKEG